MQSYCPGQYCGLIKIIKDPLAAVWRLHYRRPDGDRETTWEPVASPGQTGWAGLTAVGMGGEDAPVFLKPEEIALVNGLDVWEWGRKESRKLLLFLFKWTEWVVVSFPEMGFLEGRKGCDNQDLGCIHIDFEIPIWYVNGRGKKAGRCVNRGLWGQAKDEQEDMEEVGL